MACGNGIWGGRSRYKEEPGPVVTETGTREGLAWPKKKARTRRMRVWWWAFMCVVGRAKVARGYSPWGVLWRARQGSDSSCILHLLCATGLLPCLSTHPGWWRVTSRALVWLPPAGQGAGTPSSPEWLRATGLQKGRKNPRQYQLACSATDIPEGLTK